MNVKGGDLLQAKVMNFVWVFFVFFKSNSLAKKSDGGITGCFPVQSVELGPCTLVGKFRCLCDCYVVLGKILGRWWQIFIPKIGEMIHFDEHIFQMGWFNHQLEFPCTIVPAVLPKISLWQVIGRTCGRPVSLRFL